MGQSNYVRITPARAVAHILNMPLVPQDNGRRCCAGNDGNGRIGTPMTRSEKLTSPYLAPDPGELARLVAGVHHNPHGILGAHEYDDHTVIRALAARHRGRRLVGGERHPFVHIDSGVFAVARCPHQPGRLPARGQLPPAATTRPTPTRSPTAIGFADAREMDLHLFAEGRHERLWRSSARIRGRSPPPTVWSTGVVRGVGAECQGHQPDRRVQPLGWARRTDAGARFHQGCGSCSGRASPDGCYKFRVHGVDGSVTDRPTRSPSPPRCRRRPPRGCSSPTTPGATGTG